MVDTVTDTNTYNPQSWSTKYGEYSELGKPARKHAVTMNG